MIFILLLIRVAQNRQQISFLILIRDISSLQACKHNQDETGMNILAIQICSLEYLHKYGCLAALKSIEIIFSCSKLAPSAALLS